MSAMQASVTSRAVDYAHGGVALRGALALPAGATGKRPGLLVVHEWWGHNEYARARAEQLAGLGFVAFALDMYGAGVIAKNREEAQRLAGPFYTDRRLMRDRALAGLRVLAERPEVDAGRLGAIGYCMGGTVALELARDGAPLRAVVSFHGGLGTDTPARPGAFKARVLVCNGYEDPMIPPAEREAFHGEMRLNKVDYVFIEYGHAAHAFTNPAADRAGIAGVAYDPAADRRSWDAMKGWFAEIL